MKIDQHLLIKALSPKIATKVIQAFDRATVIVVGACWGAALLMIVFAVYTVLATSASKRAAEAALAVEPSLPQVVSNPIEIPAAQNLIARLSHRYPEVKFSLANDQSLKVTSSDGSKFRQWLTALSYIDTAYPDYHWHIETLCVGKCRGELMNATLKGERITFAAPDKK